MRAAAGRVADGGRRFRDELLAEPEVAAHLTPAEVDAALDPAGYLGSAPRLVERALAAYRERTRSAST